MRWTVDARQERERTAEPEGKDVPAAERELKQAASDAACCAARARDNLLYMIAQGDDTRLLELLGHDPDALELFYRRHVAAVTGFLARRCQSPEDLADAVAQTFLEVITSAARFDARRGSPKAWLFGIASHCAAAQGRAQRRERALSDAISGRRLLEADDFERLDRLIEAARLRPSLSKALESLPSRDRELIGLVDIDELRPVEAARLVGVSPAAVRMRLARARRRLRAALRQEHEAAPVLYAGE